MHVLDATLRETWPLLEPTATLPRLRSYSTPAWWSRPRRCRRRCHRRRRNEKVRGGAMAIWRETGAAVKS
eukprot:scaffold90574_cov63-Phaeocystis_antarctica.AAC.4